MHSSFVVAALAAIGSSALAVPLEKRADFSAPTGGDITILNYALTLEYLERKFYQEGLANYTKKQLHRAGFSKKLYDNLKEIYFDEQTHVSFLAGALGDQAVHEANYSFPCTTARSFVQLASVLEGVGVSAYLGAAAAIADKAYLTAAGAVLTVESRHSAYLRSELAGGHGHGHGEGESPFPKPFDTPLDFNAVFSLAAQFITGFAPGDPALPFAAFPPLAVVVGGGGEEEEAGAGSRKRSPCTAGVTNLTFAGAFANAKAEGLVASADTPVYAVLYSGLDTYYVPAHVSGDNDYAIDSIPGANYSETVTLPPSGQVYVVLSTADGNTTKAMDENTISGVGIVEIDA